MCFKYLNLTTKSKLEPQGAGPKGDRIVNKGDRKMNKDSKSGELKGKEE